MTRTIIDTLHKAAVLVASLDREVADELLEQMEPCQADSLRRAMLELPQVDATEERAAIQDFLELRAAAVDTPSATPAPRTVERRGHGLPAKSVSSDAPVTSPLDSASERLIAECLCEELPQTIAVALGHLSTPRASEVVSHLPASVQTQVLERLVESSPSHLQLADIREEFQLWLTHQIERSLHRADMAARLAAILEATHVGTRQRILENVSQTDARLAKELQHRLIAETS